MTAYRKDFNETKFISFLTKDNELLKKYNEIWEKVTNIIYKEFDGNPAYNEKYVKTKIKSYNGKINTNFPDTNKRFSNYLFVGSFDSLFRAGKNYYLQVLLEECKYVIKEKKIHNYITDDMEVSDSDEVNSDKKILEKIQIKKV